TVNGIDDDDGCPDIGGKQVVKLDGDRLVIDQLPTADKKGLTKAGEVIAGEMALIMRGASVDLSVGKPAVTKWPLAISMKNVKDAQQLGEALKAYLAKRGLANVEVLAAAGPPKIGGVVQERSDDTVPFVCPAGMEVKPRPEASKPRGPTPANATPAP